MRVKFPLERRAEYKLYFKLGKGLWPRKSWPRGVGFGPTVSLEGVMTWRLCQGVMSGGLCPPIVPAEPTIDRTR